MSTKKKNAEIEVTVEEEKKVEVPETKPVLEEKAVPKKEPAKVPDKKPENLMYMGPTIPGVIKKSTMFKDGVIPKKAKECIEKLPAMEKLLVSESKMVDAIKLLNKKESSLSAIYGLVEKTFIRR